MNEESTLVADLSEEQRQELHTQIASPDATLSPAPTSPGVDLIDSLSPQELADVSIQTKGAGFDPASWAAANPNASPEKLQKSADALALLEHRGFKFSDIDLWQSTKHLLSMVPAIGKWAGTALELGVVNPVASLVAPKMTPAAEAEFEKLRTKKSAELASSTEAGITGLFELGKKGIKKISRATGFLKDPLDQDPQERLNNLFGAAGMAKQQENISKGHGTMTGTLLEGAIADMERGGVHVDPKVVADLAAGDPVSFLAFPGGFKVVAGAGRTAGKVIAKVASRAEAVQLVTTLRSAQRAAAVASRAETQAAGAAAKGLESEISQVAKTGAEAFPGQGGILTAEAAPGVSAAIQNAAEASAAARAAEQTLVTAEAGVAGSRGAQLVERAQRSTSAIKQSLVEAKGAVSKAAAATSQRAVDVGLSTIPAAVGVVAKTAEGVGKIVRGILPPLATPHYVRTGAELAGKAGTSSLATAKKLFTGASETYSPSLRLISDVARSAPTVAAGAAKGFLSLDVPLAAVTSETPTDTAHMAVFGAFFGAVGKAPVAAGRIVQGQLIAPRTWSSDAAMRDYRSFSALDAANKFSIDQAKDPAKTQWLASIRDFLKPTDAQMYWVTDEKMFRDALQRYAPDKDAAWYDEAAQQRGVTLSLVDDAGKPQKVILLRDAEAAPHEAIHPFQDVLGDRAMQAIDDLVYNEYAPVWDQVGLNYALKFFGPQKMLEYQSRGEGWQEAVLDATTGTTEWRGSLSPEQVEQSANLYVSRELSAEVGDAILRNAGPELKDNDSFPGKLARILGKTMVGFGMEPFQGAGTEGQGIPLTQQTTEGIKQALRGGVEALKVEKARPDVAGMPGYGRAKAPAATPRSRTEPPTDGGTPTSPAEPPPAPNEPGGAAEKARELIPDVSDQPTIRGGRSQQEILADVAAAIESRGGLSVDYMSAPGEPAGAITSNRTARRDIVEIFRTMPAAMRKLWEKNFFPEQAVRAGNKVQIIGWSPEVFAANAHKLAKALSEKPGSPPIPYEIDKKTGTFTERGWRELYVDATNFAKNQAAGLTGAGESLVVPAGVVEKGFFPPRVEGRAGAPLDQAKADIISALFGIPIPKTPRIGKVYPRNLIGQEVSEATKPGRVSVPVEAREPFSGAKAEALGIEGQTIKEVNPFRAELEAAGVEWSPIEALQRLNLENIAAVTPTPVETAPIRGKEFTLQAGFQPKKDGPYESFAIRIRANNKVYAGNPNEVYRQALKQGDLTSLANSEIIDKYAEHGFLSHEGKFLTDAEADVVIGKWQEAREASLTDAQREERAEQQDAFVSALLSGKSIEAARQIANNRDLLGSRASLPTVGEMVDTNLKGIKIQPTVSPKARFQPADIKRFSELPAEDFVKEIRSVKRGMTNQAYDLGRSLTPEDIPALQAAERASSEKSQALMKAGDFDTAIAEGNRKQFFTEALRYRNALTAAEGITDPAKLRQIEQDFAVADIAPAGQGADFAAKFQPKYRKEDDQSSFQPKPNEDIRKLANEYALSANLTYRSPRGAKEVDPDLAKKLADYYATAKHDPKDEAVKKSYDALIDETRKQFDRIVDYGYSIEPYAGRGEPYKKSEEMMADLRGNKNLYFLKTEGNFSGEANHPMLKPSGIGNLSNNDLFRAVHDFFGHAAEGLAFGPRGEFNAWRAHSEMYSPEAQGALAAETLAQNSWVNFGEHLRNELGKIPARGEPGYVPLPERQFAEQKAVIVPAALIAEAKAVGGAGERLTENETRLLRSILDDAAEEGKAIHKHLEEIQGAVGEETFDPTKEIFDAEKQKRLVRLIKKAVEETRKRAPDDPTKLLADALLRKAESGVITPYDAGNETLTSEVSPQARFSPAKKKKARPILGMVDEESGAVTGYRVPSLANADYTHANMGMAGGIPWRFDPEANTLFWWEGKGAIPESLRESTLAWLEKKGYAAPEEEFLYSKKWEGADTPLDKEASRRAHGGNTSAAFQAGRGKEKTGDKLKFLSTSGRTPSKAWILPDGTPVQLGSKWHHDWLDQNKDIQEKYGLDIPPFEGNDAEAVREQALQAGFARVNYEPASGRMTVEARAKDWRGLKGPVQDMAEANLDNIEKFSINVLNAAANKAVDSARDEFLFQLDTPAEKSARISEMINSIEGATAGGTAGVKEPSAIEIARARFQPRLEEGDRAIFSRKNSGMWDSSNSALEEGTPVIVDEARLKDGKPFWYGVETEGGTSFRVGVNQLSKFQSGRGETDSLPGFDVAREPLHPSERASMTRQELRNHFPEAVVPRANNETLTSDIVDSPLYKDAKDEPAAVKAFADRLVAFAKEHKNDPDFDLGARWYSEFVPKLKKEYGKDAGLMAELLSATSPNTSVETNFGYAFDALESLRAGRFDKIISKFEEGLAKMEDGSWETWLKRNAGEGTMTPAAFLAAWINKFNLKPQQSNGKLYGQHSLNVLKVLAREWLGKAGGPKTKQFVENLIGRSNEATIDVWADRTMRWAGYEGKQDRWRILSENQGSVSDKDFAFSQKAFRAAADRMKMEPSALQGALWFAEKQRWADSGWSRLNLGSFQTEMEKLPELRKGFQHRMKQAEAAKKAKPREQIPLAIESRFR